MNDDFLTRYRKPPPREFSAALYERIHSPMNTQRNIIFRRLTIAVAFSLALLAALAFSPSARAAFNNLIRQVGGITYIGPEETTSQATPAPGEEYTIQEETLSLAEAQAKLPYAISLPTWAPEGFDISDTVLITYFSEEYTPVTISWSGPNYADGPINLMIGRRVNWLVDLSSMQEVQINGQAAGLTGGGWDADSGQWQGHDFTLTWMNGDLMYQLRSPSASAEDLIRMAESIP